MNILIDAHLPESLAQYFQGHDVIHVSALPEGDYSPTSMAQASCNSVPLCLCGSPETALSLCRTSS